MSSSPKARAGRRPGDSGTKAAILEAAGRQFGELGYDRTTIRSVAKEAGVDPALVTHFHGSKQQLFVAAMELPVEPAEIVEQLTAGGAEGAGERLARFYVGVLESDEGRRRMTGMVRAAASEEAAAKMVREFVHAELLKPIAETLEAGDADLRAALVGSQMVGLVMARYIVAIEPLASADPATVIATIGPTIQRYLAGPLET